MFTWRTAGCMAHSSAWGTAVSRCTGLRGTQFSQGTQLSQGAQLPQGAQLGAAQLSAAAEFQ